jgi:hypothetical protein
MMTATCCKRCAWYCAPIVCREWKTTCRPQTTYYPAACSRTGKTNGNIPCTIWVAPRHRCSELDGSELAPRRSGNTVKQCQYLGGLRAHLLRRG